MLHDTPRTLQASVQSTNETRTRQWTGWVFRGIPINSQPCLPAAQHHLPATRDVFEVLIASVSFVRSYNKCGARRHPHGLKMLARIYGAGLAHHGNTRCLGLLLSCPPYAPYSAEHTGAARRHCLAISLATECKSSSVFCAPASRVLVQQHRAPFPWHSGPLVCPPCNPRARSVYARMTRRDGSRLPASHETSSTSSKSSPMRRAEDRRLPRFGSPLTPEGREHTDLLTLHDRQDDNVFSNHVASMNRKRGDTSVMFQDPRNSRQRYDPPKRPKYRRFFRACGAPSYRDPPRTSGYGPKSTVPLHKIAENANYIVSPSFSLSTSAAPRPRAAVRLLASFKA
ncbi:hypothetical protein FA95DRAFT_1678793 [Auriscalpium vulgare]|uniref:Uncharacterized protein n=1 Tax=Auriscalpium vulgare TaxID=40419 RepID=A0ACB8RUR7_9AGAM|nr:hypothetical protein FA95DRAFT_1678793 [Auriscalpium vulgare]